MNWYIHTEPRSGRVIESFMNSLALLNPWLTPRRAQWSAPVPQPQKCHDNFAQMLAGCDNGQFNVATVNLSELPGNGSTGLPVDGGRSYPSYYIGGGPMPSTPNKALSGY